MLVYIQVKECGYFTQSLFFLIKNINKRGNNMLSITNNDKLYKNYQIKRHIPESELVARVLKKANIRGIPVSANQVQVKIGDSCLQ